jgi:hypothetical protein
LYFSASVVLFLCAAFCIPFASFCVDADSSRDIMHNQHVIDGLCLLLQAGSGVTLNMKGAVKKVIAAAFIH